MCGTPHVSRYTTVLPASAPVPGKSAAPATELSENTTVNTTTERNVEELRQRGLHILVTTTPRLEGRSFGTNVMEGTLLALMDKPQSEVTPADFMDLIERIPLEPNLEVLN